MKKTIALFFVTIILFSNSWSQNYIEEISIKKRQIKELKDIIQAKNLTLTDLNQKAALEKNEYEFSAKATENARDKYERGYKNRDILTVNQLAELLQELSIVENKHKSIKKSYESRLREVEIKSKEIEETNKYKLSKEMELYVLLQKKMQFILPDTLWVEGSSEFLLDENVSIHIAEQNITDAAITDARQKGKDILLQILQKNFDKDDINSYNLMSNLNFQFIGLDSIEETKKIRKSIKNDKILFELKNSYNLKVIKNMSSFNVNTTIQKLGLVAYLPFNGNAKNEVDSDFVSKVDARNLEYVGERNYSDHKAAYFNGESASAVLNYNINSDSYTVLAWIRTKDAGSSFRGIVVKQLTVGMFLFDNVFATFDWAKNPLVTADAPSPANNYHGRLISTNINLADNVWHFVGFTYFKNKLKMYVDGRLVKTEKFYVTNQNNNFVIGAGSVMDEQLYKGIIDDVRIYNTVLTDKEILEMMYVR